MEKPNIDAQPIIYRVTQETALNPTSIKPVTHLSQQTEPPNNTNNPKSF